jgi:hypothetical protein
MISDPKLPFASDASDVRDFQSPPDPTNPLAPVSVSGLRPTPSPVHIWLRRMGVLLFVFLCATVGVMLMIVPWRPEWSDNPLLSPYPEFRTVVASGFVRGLATGLGVLNVWIGFWEAIQYREGE